MALYAHNGIDWRLAMPGQDEFEWDDDNEGHIAPHGVRPWEAEEAARDPKRRTVPAYNQGGERRWALFGATEAGRILFVVFTRRKGRIRVVMAREASRSDKRRYRKH